MARTKRWEVSDALWERVAPVVPPAPSRPRSPDLRPLIYLVRSGEQWNALPDQFSPSSTVHDRMQEWERAGYAEYDELSGIDWQ